MIGCYEPQNNGQGHQDHCWHVYRGPIHMVIPDGCVVEKCCKCEATRIVHIEHRISIPAPTKYSRLGKIK